MPKHIMMTLDLEKGVSEENRQKFYAKLKEANWSKIPDVTTAWKCRWDDEQAAAAMQAYVKDKLTIARAAAGNCAYHAVAMIGDAEPVAFKS
jgi:hypothetical protein